MYTVAIALSGGELFYFELSPTGQLTEVMKRDMGRDVACLAVAPISKVNTNEEKKQTTIKLLAAPQTNYGCGAN